MKIILITSFIPTADNFRGPSAMMYHLLKDRPADCSLRVYGINASAVPEKMIQESRESLHADIRILKDDLYNYLHKRYTLNNLRIALGIDKYYGQGNYRLTIAITKEIEDFAPDFVWVFGEDKTRIIKQMSYKYKTLVAGFDCFPLHYERLLADPYIHRDKEQLKKALKDQKIAISREIALKDVPCKYFDVGIADKNLFQKITGRTDARFYPHPHFYYTEKTIDFNKEVLSIMVSGALNEYTYTDANKMVKALCAHSELASKYQLTFVGKGWEVLADALRASNYNVTTKTWVENYAQELALHDIQLVPISVGSGTKGKVLQAMACGVLCIGSPIAMENIFTKSGYSSFQYDSADSIPDILKQVYANKGLSAQIAEQGRKDVLKWHNPKRILDNILEDILNDKIYDGEAEFNLYG